MSATDEALMKGRCPYSGLVLHREGEAGPDWASCDVCDCFGFDPDEDGVKAWPRRPLNVVRWKVTRKQCSHCGKPFAGDKYTKICDPCFTATMTVLLPRLGGAF